MFGRLIALYAIIVICSVTVQGGTIKGFVVDGTIDQPVSDGVEVVLRVPFDGRFVVAAQSTTRPDGSFRFDDLPLALDGAYLPGANWRGIHYPGPRIRLSESNQQANLVVTVFDPSKDPCPLVVERHDITIRAAQGHIVVRETMLIRNPTKLCYVGRPRHNASGPVTMELGIPHDFKQVTFDREGFGRSFQLINQKLISGLPWPPGKRELAFSYVIENQSASRRWQRSLDFPTCQLKVTLQGFDPKDISSNLTMLASDPSSAVVLTSDEETLPADFVVEIDLDRIPVPLVVWLRSASLFVLVGVLLTFLLIARKQQARGRMSETVLSSSNGKRRAA